MSVALALYAVCIYVLGMVLIHYLLCTECECVADDYGLTVYGNVMRIYILIVMAQWGLHVLLIGQG